MVAAYALALQALLTGVAGGHFMAAGDPATSDLFAICHSSGSGSSDGQRYRADLSDIRLLTRRDRTGWLGMSDSNWRIRPRAT
jgi:hypothetical protein